MCSSFPFLSLILEYCTKTIIMLLAVVCGFLFMICHHYVKKEKLRYASHGCERCRIYATGESMLQ